MVGDKCPTVAELVAVSLAKYVSIAANDCGQYVILDLYHILLGSANQPQC